MKLKPLALLLLLFIGIGSGWYLLTQASHSDRTTDGLEIQGASPGNSSPSTTAKLASAQEDSPRSEGERLVAATAPSSTLSPEDEARASFSNSADVKWLEGTVQFAEGTPADEVIEIEVRGKEIKGESNGRRTHRVTVEKDGRFRVAIAAQSKFAVLKLMGRYSFVDEPIVWTASKSEELIFKPELGTLFEVTLLLEGPNEMQGFTANLSTYGTYFGPLIPELLDGNRLEIPGVGDFWELTLELNGDGLARITKDLENTHPGERVPLTIQMQPEAIVWGSIRASDANMVLDGKLTLVKSGHHAFFFVEDPQNQVLIKDGNFEANSLAPGSYKLVYIAPGALKEPVQIKDLQAGERRRQNVVVNAGKSIRGTVHWASGEPAVDAEVELVWTEVNETPDASDAARVVQTDEDGRFEMSGFRGEGPFEIIASAVSKDAQPPEGASKLKMRRWNRINKKSARIGGVTPGAGIWALVLGAKESGLAGQVVDDTGKPIPSFRVTASPRVGDTEEISSTGATRKKFKDSDGKFLIEDLPPGKWGIRASAIKHVRSEMHWVQTPSTQDLQLVVPRYASIAGRVISSEGAPIPSATVICSLAGNKEWGADEEHSQYPLSNPQAGDPDGDSDDFEDLMEDFLDDKYSNSNDEGNWKQTGLIARTWEVYAEQEGYGKTKPIQFALSPGQKVTDVDLVLHAPGSVKGTVAKEWLKDSLQVTISLSNGDWDDNIAETTVPVDPSGKFAFGPIPAEEYWLEVERVDDESLESEESSPFESEGSGNMDGVIRDLDNFLASTPGEALGLRESVIVTPGATAEVHFKGPGQNSIEWTGTLFKGSQGLAGWTLSIDNYMNGVPSFEVTTGSNGSFVCRIPNPGEYSVTFENPEGRFHVSQQEIEFRSTQPVTKDLFLPGRKAILALQFPNEHTVDEANDLYNFSLSPANGASVTWCVSREDNRLTFDFLAPTDYVLDLDPVFAGGVAYIVDSPTHIAIAESGDTQTFQIKMTTGCILEGTITGTPNTEDSTPVYVFTDSEGESYSHYEYFSGNTFRFDTLPPGDVWISTQEYGEEGPPAMVHINVRPGATNTVTIPYLPD